MAELADAIARMKGVRARLAESLKRRPRKLLEADVVKGATFRPGDRARDRTTGEVLHVVATHFETVLTPPPGRE